MRRVKIFVALPVRSSHLSVMTRRIRFYQLMPYHILLQMFLRECRLAFSEVNLLVNSIPLSVWTHSMGMSVWITVWAPWLVFQRFKRAVTTLHPPIDILSVCFVFYCGFGNAVLHCVSDKRLSVTFLL